MALNVISLAVVGADHPNKGKMPTRRFEIALCAPGDQVFLVREPKNPADPRAVQVQSERGVPLGYVTAERCGYIGRMIEDGRKVDAVFQASTSWGAFIRVGFDGAVPLIPYERPEKQSQIDDYPEIEPIIEYDEAC